MKSLETLPPEKIKQSLVQKKTGKRALRQSNSSAFGHFLHELCTSQTTSGCKVQRSRKQTMFGNHSDLYITSDGGGRYSIDRLTDPILYPPRSPRPRLQFSVWAASNTASKSGGPFWTAERCRSKASPSTSSSTYVRAPKRGVCQRTSGVRPALRTARERAES